MHGWRQARFPDRLFTLNRGSVQAQGLLIWIPAFALATAGGSKLYDLAGGRTLTLSGGYSWSRQSPFGQAPLFDGVNGKATGTVNTPAMSACTFILRVRGGSNDTPLAVYGAGLHSGATLKASVRLGGQFTDATFAAYSINVYDGTNVSDTVANTYKDATDSGVSRTIAVVYDGDGVTFYKDAQLLSRNTNYISGTIGAATTLTLGERGDGNWPYNGRLEEFRLYNRALSAAEVWQIWDPATRFDLCAVPGSAA